MIDFVSLLPVGASFCGSTVIVKLIAGLVLTGVPSSDSVTEYVALPLLFGAGVYERSPLEASIAGCVADSKLPLVLTKLKVRF